MQNMHLPVAVATAAASSVNPRFAGQQGGAGRDRRGVIFHNYAHLKYTNNSVTIRSLFKLFKTRILWFWHRWKRRIYFVLFHNSGIVRPFLKAAFQNKLCFFINDFEAWSVCYWA